MVRVEINEKNKDVALRFFKWACFYSLKKYRSNFYFQKKGKKK